MGTGHIRVGLALFAIVLGGTLASVLSGSVPVLAVTSGGNDVADTVPEWTAEGRQAAARLATLPPNDEMVLVPTGSFLMGSDRQVDRSAYPQELPQRTVEVDAFEIDKYEVTTVQYLRYVLANNLPPLANGSGGAASKGTRPNTPVRHTRGLERKP